MTADGAVLETVALGRLPLAEALDARERSGKRVRVGIVGSGQMGTDLLVQIAFIAPTRSSMSLKRPLKSVVP